MAEVAEAGKAGAERPLDKAADRLRDSAKWLLAAFGAVAAVSFAGLTVADLGDLDGDTPGYRLAWALVGGTVAVVGVIVALAEAMQLAGASTTTLDDLTRPTRRWERSLKKTQADLRNDSALQAWNGNVEAFVADYGAAYSDYLAWTEAYANDKRKRLPDQSRLKKAYYRLEVLSEVADRLLSTTSFLRLQRSFLRARLVVGGFLIASAAGVVTFAWATSSAPDEPLVLERHPTAGTLKPDKDVTAEINRQVADECEVEIGQAIPVVVLAESDDATLEVVTNPDDECDFARLRVPVTHVTQP